MQFQFQFNFCTNWCKSNRQFLLEISRNVIKVPEDVSRRHSSVVVDLSPRTNSNLLPRECSPRQLRKSINLCTKPGRRQRVCFRGGRLLVECHYNSCSRLVFPWSALLSIVISMTRKQSPREVPLKERARIPARHPIAPPPDQRKHRRKKDGERKRESMAFGLSEISTFEGVSNRASRQESFCNLFFRAPPGSSCTVVVSLCTDDTEIDARGCCCGALVL